MPRDLYRQAPFACRDLFGDFFNAQGYAGPGVEVGSHLGLWARAVLDRWTGGPLYAVDPWADEIEGYDKHPRDPITLRKNREADYLEARRRLAQFGDRAKLIRDDSAHAAALAQDASFDWVYIDANHRHEAVAADIARWWPKVRPSGVLAGHDIVCPGEIDGGWGAEVQPAVEAFARAQGLVVYLVIEIQCLPWSWYVVKPPAQ